MKKELEHLEQLASDARYIMMAEHVLFPVLDAMIEQAAETMCCEFKAHNDWHATFARFVALRDLNKKFLAMKQRGEHAQEHINKLQTKDGR